MSNNTTVKSNRVSSRTYLITGLSMVSIYFILMLLLRLFQLIMSTNGLDNATTTESYPVVIYIYGLFYFLVPISFFLAIPVGVTLIIIGLVKRNKKLGSN